ncbi:redoxin domain-containing protein [Streptomyces shenzhenensis]|uniref:redoxin domain-containing protein n=1 Tax=Streptomyces shenzhenensis TaxID=943815 RepID=UPI001C68FC00|nr:redoxin domain-containing protein [Streptomyces shenzhenensis]
MTVADQSPSAPPAHARLPLIGDRAPDFEAESAHGPVRLSDYAGRWLVLFCHPASSTRSTPSGRCCTTR